MRRLLAGYNSSRAAEECWWAC